MSTTCSEEIQSPTLPIWSRYKISPTYQSSDLFTPLQIPFRDTVPRSHTVSEGTSSCLPCVKYLQCPRDDLAIKDGEIISLRNKTLEPWRLVPTGHRPIISKACTKAIHPSYQSRKIGSILFSKLRINDEFIPPSNVCDNYKLFVEDNHFVQEPCYSSHMSKNDMFPHARGEYEIPPLPHEFRQTQPLSDTTRQALLGVVRRRYKASSYASDYQNPNKEPYTPSYTKPETEEQKELPKENLTGHEIQGLWPCWPPGRRSVVSELTGQVVEKRDVTFVDDAHDYRNYKMSPPKEPREDKSSFYKTKIASFAAADLIPLDDIDFCGCGPGRIGSGNPENVPPFSIFQQKEASRQKPPQRTFYHYPAWTPDEPSRPEKDLALRSVNVDAKENQFSHQANFEKLDSYHGQNNYDLKVEQRWEHQNRRDRQSERVDKHPYGATGEKRETQMPRCLSEEGEELNVEEVEEEKVEDEEIEEQLLEKSENKSSQENENILNFNTPFYSSTRYYPFEKKTRPSNIPDPFTLSLEYDRRDETVSRLLNSSTHPLEAQTRFVDNLRSKRIQLGSKIAETTKKREECRYTPDPNNFFYRPPIPLPPKKLWTALEYNGDRVPHRLGVQFKTIASKRYHAVHPEITPDLRDNHPYLRRTYFLGYHSSVFR